jgi:hypothetical protein
VSDRTSLPEDFVSPPEWLRREPFGELLKTHWVPRQGFTQVAGTYVAWKTPPAGLTASTIIPADWDKVYWSFGQDPPKRIITGVGKWRYLEAPVTGIYICGLRYSAYHGAGAAYFECWPRVNDSSRRSPDTLPGKASVGGYDFYRGTTWEPLLLQRGDRVSGEFYCSTSFALENDESSGLNGMFVIRIANME